MGAISVSVLLPAMALALLECFTFVEANIQCYRCIVAAPVVNYNNGTVRLCKDFDYSDKFIVNCPYSTFCMKKIFTAKIPFTVNGIERDCASQKQKRHTYSNRTWYTDYYIEDAYKEGCEMINDKGARTSTSEYCYCEGSLCNSAGVAGYSLFFYILLAVIVLSKSFLCYSAV